MGPALKEESIRFTVMVIVEIFFGGRELKDLLGSLHAALEAPSEFCSRLLSRFAVWGVCLKAHGA